MTFDIDAFDWESPDQKKGFMNLFQYLRRHGVDPRYQDVPGRLLAAYLIQRDLESNDWWLELLNTQAGRLFDEIKRLHSRVEHLEARRGHGVDQSLVLGDNGVNTEGEGV